MKHRGIEDHQATENLYSAALHTGYLLLVVKNNQPTLAAAIEQCFDTARDSGNQKLPHTVAEWVEQDHGRSVTRRCVVTTDLSSLGALRTDWPGPQALVIIETQRDSQGQVSTERRY